MTTPDTPSPFEALERIFHEPNRLAIMSALCAEEAGSLSFRDLKEITGMTDGNLNRHLNVLAKAGTIRITKAFVKNKPRTTVTISKKGLQRFTEYLNALEDVLNRARRVMPAQPDKSATISATVRLARA